MSLTTHPPRKLADADNKLSLAASTLLRWHALDWTDYAMDASGDCGQLIADSHYARDCAMLAGLGFTPGAFADAIRSRIRETHAMYQLLAELLYCARCGAMVETTITPTRQYGGGFDTFERCTQCGHAEVYV